MGVVGDTKLALRAEHQDEDVGDLAANEVDQQQVAQRLLGRAELGVGRDLDDERLRVIAPGAPGEEQSVRELGGQDQFSRRRLPTDQVGDATEAKDGVAVVLDEPLALPSLSLAGSGMVHLRAPESRTVRPRDGVGCDIEQVMLLIIPRAEVKR